MYLTSNPLRPLELFPHYTDQRFRREQHVYLAEPWATRLREKAERQGWHGLPLLPTRRDYERDLTDTIRSLLPSDAAYDYSDRLQTRYSKRWDEALEVAKAFPERSAAGREAFLSCLLEQEVKLLHIVVGINHSNGWCYQVYGYQYKQ